MPRGDRCRPRTRGFPILKHLRAASFYYFLGGFWMDPPTPHAMPNPGDARSGRGSPFPPIPRPYLAPTPRCGAPRPVRGGSAGAGRALPCLRRPRSGSDKRISSSFPPSLPFPSPPSLPSLRPARSTAAAAAGGSAARSGARSRPGRAAPPPPR